MIIDVNTYIGSYPFRKIPSSTAAELSEYLDKFGIDRACVGSSSAIYYHDVMDGNRDLIEEIKPFGDKFIPFCVINPMYACAKEDFLECINVLGFKGVRIYPRQHTYSMSDPKCIEFLNLCGEMNIPVQIQLQIEDVRQRHNLDIPDIVTASEIYKAVALTPDTNYVLSNAYLNSYAPHLAPLDQKRKGKIYYDLGRIDNLYQTSFTEVYDAAGAAQIVFGSGAPMQYIGVELLKIMFLKETDNLSDLQIEQIKSKNILSILK